MKVRQNLPLLVGIGFTDLQDIGRACKLPVATLFGCVTFSRLQESRYQCILKATVSGVLEDLKFKILEGSDQN